MRLSDILSRPPIDSFLQIDGFMEAARIKAGTKRKLDVGKVALNYFCEHCGDIRTFTSGNTLFALDVNLKTTSIDCVLECHCGASVQIWFLVESEGDIRGQAPFVRILKRSEKLSDLVQLSNGRNRMFSDLLAKSHHAYQDRLGAGAVVYLRIIFEKVISDLASANGISTNSQNGRRKSFKNLLEEVNGVHAVVPREFSENGYRLFGELSEILHGQNDEARALEKYSALHRLVVGILDNVQNNQELMAALRSLGWNTNSAGATL